MTTHHLRAILSVPVIAGVMLLSVARAASAESVYLFSFINTIGNVSGVVSGRILGLTDNCVECAATEVTVDVSPEFPFGHTVPALFPGVEFASEPFFPDSRFTTVNGVMQSAHFASQTDVATAYTTLLNQWLSANYGAIQVPTDEEEYRNRMELWWQWVLGNEFLPAGQFSNRERPWREHPAPEISPIITDPGSSIPWELDFFGDSGSLMRLAASGDDVYGPGTFTRLEIESVPEPSVFTLLGTGLLALAVGRRWRRRSEKPG